MLLDIDGGLGKRRVSRETFETDAQQGGGFCNVPNIWYAANNVFGAPSFQS